MVTGEENFFDPEHEYELLLHQAKSLLERKFTREEALQMLIDAGITDTAGNLTEPYKALQGYRF